MKVLQSLKQNYILISILLFGAILRFHNVDFQSVWLDEIHTLNESNPNITWSEFYKLLLTSEPHPPLYFALARILFSVFGYSAIVLRLFSALLGVVGLYAMYVLGKEMSNKKTGLIAAFLLSINYFHLYYSQDGRPYIFLVLFTIFAFYRLILFIKIPNRKNAIWYGVGAALMIYGHFFGLFALFTQYLILLFFFILIEKKNRLTFFVNALIAGIITLILFTPATELFIATTQIKNFWIPAPTIDAYTLIFKEFFGNSELVLPMVGFIFYFYFLKLSKARNFAVTYKSIIDNRTVFNFIILLPWIVIVILIPLIRSYVTIPMLISRYFIVVLPAIILILSIGICQFNNKVIRVTILSLFFVFSMTDLLIVKKYYSTVSKAQFREATNFIINNNTNNTPVVSSLGWYMPYFLKNGKTNFVIIDKPLENYILEMQQDTTKIKPFWYFDGHGREYTLSEGSQNFVNKTFYIENNFDGVQAWTKHFILLKDVPKTVDISKFKKLKPTNGDLFIYNLETFDTSTATVKISGWAYFEKQDATKSVLYLVLVKEGVAHRLESKKVFREDVTTYFKSDFDLSNSGFNGTVDLATLEAGKYELGLYLTNKESKKEGLVLTGKYVENH